MKPIWYFVGLILLVIGCILFLTGLYLLISPQEKQSVIGDLHPDIWWGGFMVIVGILFVLGNRKKVVQ